MRAPIGDLLAAQAVRVAAPVVPLVVVADELEQPPHGLEGPADQLPEIGVLADHR